MQDDNAQIKTLIIPANGGIPNNPLLPAVIVKAAVSPDLAGSAVRRLYQKNGWGGSWEYTVFDYHHFHPSSHEALTCISGQATLQLGGNEGPVIDVSAGDALVLPAGFGHKRLTSSGGFTVAGAYPPGQESPAILPEGAMDLDEALAAILATPLPATDPLQGRNGPLVSEWQL